MNNHINISLRRIGKINPLSIEDYIKQQGFEGLKKALKLKPYEVINCIEKSGLRGRGGAGFPTYIKQRNSALSCNNCKVRYIVCNADEGEPGTFKDRIIMENDPFSVVEGIIIAGYAIGARYGFIYIRGEYYTSIKYIKNAIVQSYEKGFLGENILGSNFSFDIDVYLGAGSYLCGEELTLIESLEGKRGYPRIKPPFPAEKGLFGMPTLVNNVETLNHIPFILEKGYEWYASIGTTESKGTKLFCVSGHVNNPGVYELAFGSTLRELIFNVAGGMKNGYVLKGALLGGAAGTFVDDSLLDIPLAYETLKAVGATLGSGAVIVIDNRTDMLSLLQSIISFFKHESCGKCVPCRIGTTLLYNKLQKQPLTPNDCDWIYMQAEYMEKYSLCPLGQSVALPIKSILKYFKKDLL